MSDDGETAMKMAREPGCYWVKRAEAPEWEIVQVHPADDYGQSIDSMGLDAVAYLLDGAEWGPRISPPAAPVHVAVFDDGRFDFVRRFSVLAEAEAFKSGIDSCPSLHSSAGAAYLLPGQEAEMCEWQPEAPKALAALEEER